MVERDSQQTGSKQNMKRDFSSKLNLDCQIYSKYHLNCYHNADIIKRKVYAVNVDPFT